MMTNLFSSFDPSTSKLLSMNWMSAFLPLLMISTMYWTSPNRNSIMTINLFSYINKETHNNIASSNMKIIILFSSIFWSIMINNLLGLYPYIFTSTSHMMMTLTLALPMWLLFMMFGWMNKTTYMFSHLVPLGTPLPLSSFMVLIETTSNIIRPITLSVRLSANMIAGHLLMTLLSQIPEYMPNMFIYTLPILMSLLTLEYAVTIIQSYVFITLLSLYMNEIN